MRTVSTLLICAAAAWAFTIPASSGADNVPKLLDLGAKKCIPCKLMAPILEELTEEYVGRLDVEFIDVWQKENASKAEQHGIKTIPTQIFFSAEGKELWRHEGFISKEDILAKWRELGLDLQPSRKTVERWEAAEKDTRARDQVCYLCDGAINPNAKVTVQTEHGDVNLCSMHHFFVMLSCLQKDVVKVERTAAVTDGSTDRMVPALSAAYLLGAEAATGRPTIKAFSDRKAAETERVSSGGSVLAYEVLKQKELEPRCGFCDRAVYPQDASLVRAGPGLQTWGCCAHCALGVAARMGMDIQVQQPDSLSGEIITIKTLNGSVSSIEPPGAIAWFGQRKRADGTFGSAGCFHQGNFVNQSNLKAWLERNPLETGCEITIDKALADKMKLSTAQIQKACKIGECSPK